MRTDLRVALPKDGLAPAVQLLEKAGIPVPAHLLNSRAYLIPFQSIEWLIVKPIDIPLLVERGAADLGIAGKHIIMEQAKETVELLELGTNRVELTLFGDTELLSKPDLKVATKYPNITSSYFMDKGRDVRTMSIIYETGPMSDAVVADVSEYMNPMGRKVLDTVLSVTDRLIANRSSFVVKKQRIDEFCSSVARVV
ncbi:ATP phosphoribosyltransferase [Paenibacillus sp. UNC451MF]|uniref:ATP phosphoribosyltransferase n=1 Tax=Paenibacillus sp. UNC451MF TaxID=1449063 RepID=UPI00048B721B|nr:ATP phosphoribosyltransferase [Paenibacillus sp. UNC451MF]